jgi:succinate-acetate transporter protein
VAQLATETNHEHAEAVTSEIAHAVPLGLSAFAFTTALLGAVYAGFIVPSIGTNLSIAVGAALFFGGAVQVLAGIGEFKRENIVMATVFSAYGGFLAALGAVFIPGFGILDLLSRAFAVHPALGLFFLCWTISSAVLFLGAFRTNLVFLGTLGFLSLGYLFLTIGELAGGDFPFFTLGGWLAIVSALLAWYTALAGLLSAGHSTLRLPVGHLG